MDKLELLYDHYKETFSIIKEDVNNRNRFFVILFIVMSLQFLFAISPESITSLIINVIISTYNVDISGQMVIIQCFLWFILLYFTIRYYQTTVNIEKSYNYIHSLEDEISSIILGRFDREGKNYLSDYPKIKDLIDILYKWFFPIIYCIVICVRIISEYKIAKSRLPLVLDISTFIACFVLTICYLKFLHTDYTKNKEDK